MRLQVPTATAGAGPNYTPLILLVALFVVGGLLAFAFWRSRLLSTTTPSLVGRAPLTVLPTVTPSFGPLESTTGPPVVTGGGPKTTTTKKTTKGASTAAPPPPPPSSSTELRRIFSMPTPYITDISPLPNGRAWLAGKDGKIFIGDVQTGQFSQWMTIEDRVESRSEAGLYSIVAHPQYAQNGLFFVKYANRSGMIVIARGRAGAEDATASPASLQTVLEINHVDRNQLHHYGGQDRFGPGDGMLYISIGDTQSRPAPQNTRALQGKILRINPSTGPMPTYTNPPNNPHGNEVLHWGLRQPHTLHFGAEGELWVVNVGTSPPQGREQVYRFDPGSPGRNLGWATRECGGGDCGAGIYPPLFSWTSGELGACIIGGCFYVGQRYPTLANCYIFAGYNNPGANNIYAWNRQTRQTTRVTTAPGPVSRIEWHRQLDIILVAVRGELHRLG